MTARQLSARMRRRRDRVLPVLLEVSQDVARSALRYSKELMSQQIYAIPEDLTTRGKVRFERFLARRRTSAGANVFRPRKGDRKWVRTGHLRRSEGAQVVAPGEVAVFNTAVYAAARHEAGKATSEIVKKPRKINPLRVSHWQDDMARVMRPIALDLWREGVQTVLREL